MLAPPPRKARASPKTRPVKPIKVNDTSEKRNEHQHKETSDESELHAEHSTGNNTAPFGKLASKMRLMLRRKSTTGEKKKEKKEKDYYGPEEDLHWTEM